MFGYGYYGYGYGYGFGRTDLYVIAALLVCMIISVVASIKVKTTYSKFDKIPNRRGITGHEAARRLLQMNAVHGVSVGCVQGNLSDHYHPTKGIVNLSTATYSSSSVAAVAVAAHEIGHVVQHKCGTLSYRLRTALVTVTNVGSVLALPLVLIGFLLDLYVQSARDTELGFYLAMFGVVLYSLSFIFTLVTLPVELDASRRAGKMLLAAGILSEDELPGAKKVLSAAAMTYVASMLTSLVYFLRFLLMVLSMFGKRDD